MKRTAISILCGFSMLVSMLLPACKVKELPPPLATTTLAQASVVAVTLGSASIPNGGNTTVTATVTDSLGAVVPNATVSFAVISASAGSFNPASAVTDNSGVATTVFTAAAAGNDSTATITATVTGSAQPLTGSATIIIGTPAVIPTTLVVSLSTYTLNPGPGAVTVTATLTGAGSTPVSGATVTFTASDATAGSFSAGSATTNASGVATVTFNANSVDTLVQITATAGTLSNSANLTIGNPPPPTPASISVAVSPLSVNIQGQATVTATLLDSQGKPAFSNAVTLTITSGTTLASFASGTTLLTTNLMTNAAGIATATVFTGASSGAVTVQATAGSLAPASASFFITSDPATITLNVANSNLVNGQTTNVSATVRNVLGNPVTDGTQVSFAITSLPPYAGSLSASAASTVNGVASVTFTADASLTGGVILQATAGTLNPVQTIIIVNQAQAGSIEFVSASPTVINIKGAGTSDSTVTFKVLNVAGSPLANQSVNFQLNGPTGATLDTGGLTTSSGSTDASGQVTTIVHAGYVAGTVNIIASTQVPGPPPTTLYASAGALSIGGGVPSDKFFSVAATKLNIGALNGSGGIGCLNQQSTISAFLADRFGNYNILQNTSVSFNTDSGAIDTSNVTDATGITSAIYRTQDPAPDDVAPAVWEPSYIDGTGRTRNPRDGWITILIRVTGEEYFQDDNANGVYDSGEPFTDLPEPFIDSNDNGARDVGEQFYDWPATVPGATAGSYDGVNGVWDGQIPLYREINLVLTGPPNFSTNTTRVDDGSGGTGPITIARGASHDFVVHVSDINMNALVAGTEVTAAADKTEATVTLAGGSSGGTGDGLSTGPDVWVFRVTNNNTSSPAVSVSAYLSITLVWPGGGCGGTTITFNYPSAITLP